jgi:hypothetical protein
MLFGYVPVCFLGGVFHSAFALFFMIISLISLPVNKHYVNKNILSLFDCISMINIVSVKFFQFFDSGIATAVTNIYIIFALNTSDRDHIITPSVRF